MGRCHGGTAAAAAARPLARRVGVGVAGAVVQAGLLQLLLQAVEQGAGELGQSAGRQLFGADLDQKGQSAHQWVPPWLAASSAWARSSGGASGKPRARRASW